MYRLQLRGDVRSGSSRLLVRSTIKRNKALGDAARSKMREIATRCVRIYRDFNAQFRGPELHSKTLQVRPMVVLSYETAERGKGSSFCAVGNTCT